MNYFVMKDLSENPKVALREPQGPHLYLKDRVLFFIPEYE